MLLLRRVRLCTRGSLHFITSDAVPPACPQRSESTCSTAEQRNLVVRLKPPLSIQDRPDRTGAEPARAHRLAAAMNTASVRADAHPDARFRLNTLFVRLLRRSQDANFQVVPLAWAVSTPKPALHSRTGTGYAAAEVHSSQAADRDASHADAAC
jgi:hypothetical protein